MKTTGAFVVGFLLGAALLWVTGERYRIFAAGSGKVMRVDRWTGASWMQIGVSHWQPVEMEDTISAAEAKKLRDEMELHKIFLRDATAQRDAIQGELNQQLAHTKTFIQSIVERQNRYKTLIAWYQANPNGGKMINVDGREAFVASYNVNESAARAKERLAVLEEIVRSVSGY